MVILPQNLKISHTEPAEYHLPFVVRKIGSLRNGSHYLVYVSFTSFSLGSDNLLNAPKTLSY